MPIWSVLLRLLLAVALVFNGAAQSVAAVHMGHMGSATALVVSSDVEHEAMPCHGHHQSATTAGTHAMAGHSAVSHDGPASDCCKSGSCRCACVHSAPAAIVAANVILPVIEHVDLAQAMPSGHADAALPHLIRPPIG